MFAILQGINVFAEVDVVPEEAMADCTLERASDFGAEIVVVPWSGIQLSEVEMDGKICPKMPSSPNRVV
jgi:hypothetical protein